MNEFNDLYFSVEDINEIVLNEVQNHELSGYEAVEEAVAVTLGYVVEWLRERGDSETSDTLHYLSTGGKP